MENKIFSLKESLLNANRKTKKAIVALNDYFIFFLSTFIALSITTNSVPLLTLEQLLKMLGLPLLGVSTFFLLGVYQSILRYIDFSFIFNLVKAILAVYLLELAFSFLFGDYFRSLFAYSKTYISLEGNTIGFLFSIILITGSRIAANSFFITKFGEKRIVIYGAGSAGIQLASALKVSSEMRLVAFVDDNTSMHGSYVGDIKVLPPRNLKKLVKKGKVEEVLFAMPSQSRSSLRSMLKEIEKYSIKVRILPGVSELAQGKVSVGELKEVNTEDLLGRLEINADQRLINKNIKEKVVMVTGAGGSIGAEISRQVLVNNPKLLILFDLSEFSLYSIKQELLERKSKVRIESILGNVRNKDRINQVCQTFGVQTIYHAAAYKHVPLVEENSFEAVSNNIFGTLNCALAAIENKVETFVLISTDKAVRPTNIMGASKRFSELVLQSLSKEHGKDETKITMVRFGNVLGSSGSAIPLFQKQISEGGPLTVTDPEVVRYFMSISEAAELVIQAGAMGTGGEVFVLDMGEPVRILDLAEKLIRLSGMEIKSVENPEGDIEIIFTGLRPGEKLFEELLIGDNVGATEHPQIYRANEDFLLWENLKDYIDFLKKAESTSDHQKLRDIFKQTVSGFMPEKEILDVIYLEQNKLT
jgi:FlaA1/EpsC-like NDP-sugar epimerase